jgi:circadian clock protein KaiC
MTTSEESVVEKLKTGIIGFDSVANGGLPKGRTTLVAGTAGSAKTVFAAQFLLRGITEADEGGVFVTFEEPPDDIRKNLLSFGWDITAHEAAGKWAFVDVSPHADDQAMVVGDYDLGALLARIEHAINKVGATRVSVDSLGAIFGKFQQQQIVRRELLRLAMALKRIGVTSILTAERTQEYGEIARHGIEEFVADNVIILRNVLDAEKRRRTMEILKFRGTDHQKGEFPFTITAERGIIGVPLSMVKLDHLSSNIRIHSGSAELDGMCDGGFFRDSIVLVSGATGAGKTLMSTEFIAAAEKPERCLLFAYEESRDQLIRNATGWGLNFEEMEQDGRLKILCEYPEVLGLEDHLVKMKDEIEEFKPTRIAVDSLSALERVSTLKSFREFVIGLTSYIKSQEIAGLFTSVTPSLMGGTSITETHISTITDSIILLRYVEMFGEISRGIAVLKMRGSYHDKEIREFKIDSDGMHIGKPFRNITGIISGNPVYVAPTEQDRLGQMFNEE